MNKIIKKIPVPITGLMLALVVTGNLIQSYGEIYRYIFGIISVIILVLFLIKFVLYFESIKKDLNNPVVASSFSTFSMAIMLLSTYIKPFMPSLAFIIWVIGLILHIILIVFFTVKYVLKFNINQVFPSWFIPYIGIVVGSVTGPGFEMAGIGRILFWFGIISYIILLPIILKRVFKVKGIPEMAQPTISIFAAPVALSLAGYINSFSEKNMFLLWILVAVSQFSYWAVLTQFPRLLKLRFYPSYSAFTFPLAISAISIKLTNGYLINKENPITILKYLVKIEEGIAVLIVLYVLIRYIGFLFEEPSSTKRNS